MKPALMMTEAVTEKKITALAKNNFHIRNNSCKYGKKSAGDRIVYEAVAHNFESNNYQDLMAKFIRSKDLD